MATRTFISLFFLAPDRYLLLERTPFLGHNFEDLSCLFASRCGYTNEATPYAYIYGMPSPVLFY